MGSPVCGSRSLEQMLLHDGRLQVRQPDQKSEQKVPKEAVIARQSD